ncbi:MULTISPECIES: ATP-dependent zinc metalloprotease FtsH [Burkholderiaceae]|uniref:ATP-dependent zinc metalloprotease FtsH n=2 Tax=Burkholderiaceae TaxID=119060 RepID=A4JV52_BURVG|nr:MULTISPECIES: ATP-dependent zinc metalloprotease FtsH [Burkholderiaceae]ABO60155.1 membrane protease FtsH catalytic subunit [Burkholderia vietnamiensis G4]ASW03716.1 cell division protein FtsH [Paraburkholderia aromaticivorans]MBR8008573.1 ATP-dependent zinc metalloprotease FtsH [Burkholderia vietnamiensis]MBR8054681.1 ATP-dependent zinc metalloprotease FtsH [Burkholderia vietnamiensis]MCB4349707.1 ATP-dependent zinc metalloprotease FtsH [Burkholderia vietnamiensis]
MEIKREHQINVLYIVAAFLAVMMIQSFFAKPDHIRTIPYSEFQQLVSQGKVTDLVIGPTQITGTYKDVTAKDVEAGKPQHFSTLRVEPGLAQDLAKANLVFSGEPSPGLLPTILGWLMPAIGFALVWMFLIRPMAMGGGAGGMMAIGKSKAKIYVEKDTKVTFADVAGVDEAKDELKEVVSFLKDPRSYGRLGAHVPKGVLLVGPPGTGKTLLARAVAGEAGVAFFSISGSEFVEMFVGVGAARVRDLFEQARQHAPAIVFIDELDSLGRARGSALPGGGGHDEKEQTLNQLLSELDGFDTSIGVVLLAATNRPEILDPALLRAGRFDRQVLVDRPDKKGRCEILAVHLKKIRLASGVPVADIAALTPGFSGADLANLVNEAALLATRRNADDVTLDDFTQAIERIVAGLEKRNRLLNPHEREVVAHHEMGHALVAMALPGVDPVQKISIIPRGIAALGYTIQRPIEDRFLMDRGELMNRMAVLLGGRAAESLVFEEVSTGAADDLAKASDIARSMVVRFGMDPKLGQVAYEPESVSALGMPAGTDWRPRQYGEETATAIDTAVRELIEVAFKRASSILTANRTLLGEAAHDLLARETMSGEALQAIAARLADVVHAGSELRDVAAATVAASG